MSQVFISREDAILFLDTIGYKTAKFWDDKKLQRQLNRINSLVGASEIQDEEARTVFQKIDGHIRAGRELVLR